MGRVSWSVGMKEDSSQLKGEERWFCRKEVKDKSLLICHLGNGVKAQGKTCGQRNMNYNELLSGLENKNSWCVSGIFQYTCQKEGVH